MIREILGMTKGWKEKVYISHKNKGGDKGG